VKGRKRAGGEATRKKEKDRGMLVSPGDDKIKGDSLPRVSANSGISIPFLAGLLSSVAKTGRS
jgi:hypothetical protein